jgi:dimethyl sulfoxide reductase iron-sulfur subunit
MPHAPRIAMLTVMTTASPEPGRTQMPETRPGQEGAPEASPAGARRITRRRLVTGLGAAAGVTAAAGLGLPVIGRTPQAQSAQSVTDADLAKHQWVMVFDLRKCDGCGKCQDACDAMHYLHPDQPWIKIHQMQDSEGQSYFMPQPCMQCEDPPCTKVCPVKATYRVADGVTLIDETRCIGCRMCLAACPYEARTFAWRDPLPAPQSIVGPSPEFPVPQVKGTAGKCVMCVHNTRVGKLPGCVSGCTMDAIYLGDLVTDVMTNGTETYRLSDYLRDNDAFRLREELNTRPRVYYVAGHGQALNF